MRPGGIGVGVRVASHVQIRPQLDMYNIPSRPILTGVHALRYALDRYQSMVMGVRSLMSRKFPSFRVQGRDADLVKEPLLGTYL